MAPLLLRLLRLGMLAALSFGAPTAAAASDCPTGDQAPKSSDADALMDVIERNFRRGPRVVRMDIRTTYQRQPSRGRSEAYQPNQRILWGVFDGDEEETHLLYVFSGPGRLAGTALLMHDRVATNEPDGMWLYLRAFDIFRKFEADIQHVLVPGTALTYEDSRGFLPRDKYFFIETPSQDQPDAGISILGCPRSASVRDHLGYRSLHLRVDPEKKIVLQVTYSDLRGLPLKSYSLLRDTRVGDRFFPAKVRLEHKADGFVSEIDYEYWLPDSRPPASTFEADMETGRFIDRLETYLTKIGLGGRIRDELDAAEIRVEEFYEKLRRIQQGEP
jgi:hypothetical protein